MRWVHPPRHAALPDGQEVEGLSMAGEGGRRGGDRRGGGGGGRGGRGARALGARQPRGCRPAPFHSLQRWVLSTLYSYLPLSCASIRCNKQTTTPLLLLIFCQHLAMLPWVCSDNPTSTLPFIKLVNCTWNLICFTTSAIFLCGWMKVYVYILYSLSCHTI